MLTECQYIGPDQTQPPYKICGCKTLWPGRAYCEEHVWQVYQKGTGIGVSRKNRAIEKELAAIKELESMDDDR
jgi:hypothetical protein